MIEQIYLEKDFKNRTLLKIIADYKFNQLLASDKVNVLLESMWNGKNSDQCDGQLKDYSILYYLLKAKLHRIPGKQGSLTQVVTNGFKITENTSVFFQYKYRHESINYIFYKELILAAILVGYFQFLNFNYLSAFQQIKYEHLTQAEQEAYV